MSAIPLESALPKVMYTSPSSQNDQLFSSVVLSSIISIDESPGSIDGSLQPFTHLDDINNFVCKVRTKLEHYGIRGIALNWFKYYLHNCSQFVHLNGINSEIKIIICGVPQGSVLGPLLFYHTLTITLIFLINSNFSYLLMILISMLKLKI